MIIMYPIAFPIARLLEHFLGKHERGFYKRAGKVFKLFFLLLAFNLKLQFRIERIDKNHGRVKN